MVRSPAGRPRPASTQAVGDGLMVSSLAQQSERTNGETRSAPPSRSPGPSVGRSLARRQNIDATGVDVRACSAAAVAWRGRHGDGVETGAPSKESVRPSLPSAARPGEQCPYFHPEALLRSVQLREDHPLTIASFSVFATSIFPCLMISFTCALSPAPLLPLRPLPRARLPSRGPTTPAVNLGGA